MDFFRTINEGPKGPIKRGGIILQPPLWPQILLQVILIALNAYFAATEIALLSLNEGVLRKKAEEGAAGMNFPQLPPPVLFVPPYWPPNSRAAADMARRFSSGVPSSSRSEVARINRRPAVFSRISSAFFFTCSGVACFRNCI